MFKGKVSFAFQDLDADVSTKRKDKKNAKLKNQNFMKIQLKLRDNCSPIPPVHELCEEGQAL